MHASQQAFLGGILDYAGLFPPAELPPATSIRDYVRYRSEPEAWMLARFTCPADRLHECGPYAGEHFTSSSPWRISALGRSADGPRTFLDNLQRDELRELGFI